MLWWILFGIIAAAAVIYAGAYRGPFRTALPSQKGTEGAKAQLRAAHAIVQRIKENYKKLKFDEAHNLLTAASRTLVQAKKLDPGAVFKTPDDLSYTHDTLAARTLYLMAYYWYERGQELIGDMDTENYDVLDRLAKEAWKEAVKHAERSVKFEPDNVEHLVMLARAQHKVSFRKMRRTIQRIFELDPGNVDAITLQNLPR